MLLCLCSPAPVAAAAVLHKRSAAIMLGAILEAEQQAQQAQQDQPGRRLGEQAQGAPVQE